MCTTNSTKQKSVLKEKNEELITKMEMYYMTAGMKIQQKHPFFEKPAFNDKQ